MSTPAAAALNDAGTQPAGTSGTPPAAGSQTPAGTGTAAANQGQFWSAWDKPDQKDVREWVAAKNYADPFVLAKSARDWDREAATLRAGKGYPVDKVNADGSIVKADENARKAWNALVGVPETADKYDIPLPENNPYPQFKTFMAEELHKVGVPAAMAPLLAKGYESAVGKMEAELRKQEDTQSEASLKALELNWGAQYQERIAFAARGKTWLAQEAGGLNDLQMRTLEAVLGTDKFLTAMWKIGAGNREAAFAGGDSAGAFTGGASEAQARLDQITAERAAGKITDFQWRETYEKEVLQLRDRIVQGMASH